MAFPRPSSPRKVLADLRTVFVSENRYRYGFGLLAILMPCAVIGVFLLGGKEAPYKDPEIVFVKNYSGNRTDAQIEAQLKLDYEKEKPLRDAQRAAEEKRRKFFKDLRKSMDDAGL